MILEPVLEDPKKRVDEWKYPEGSLASVEGVLDISVIIPACFDNPPKDHSVLFLSDIVSVSLGKFIRKIR